MCGVVVCVCVCVYVCVCMCVCVCVCVCECVSVCRVLSSGGAEASTPNSLASTPKNSNCNTNYYGLGPT